MVNMDYPGPCMSCHAIEGCATEEAQRTAAAAYCSNVERELGEWRKVLADSVARFDVHADRVHIADSVAELKAIVRDIEAKTVQLDAECTLDVREDTGIGVTHLRALEVIGAGSFGG